MYWLSIVMRRIKIFYHGISQFKEFFLILINKHKNANDMKNLYLSQDFLREMIDSLEKVIENPHDFLISFDEKEILREEQIAQMLSTTTRSVRTYRKKNEIRALKLGGNVLYLRTVFFLDILILMYKQQEGK